MITMQVTLRNESFPRDVSSEKTLVPYTGKPCLVYRTKISGEKGLKV